MTEYGFAPLVQFADGNAARACRDIMTELSLGFCAYIHMHEDV